MHPLIVFDDGKGLLGPLTDLRPAFDVRTGALTTLERIRLSGRSDVAALFVPEPLEALARATHPDTPVNRLPQPDAEGEVLVINGRWALCTPRPVEALKPGEALLDPESGELLAALLKPARARPAIEGDLGGLAAAPFVAPDSPAGPARQLQSRPWHVRSDRDACIGRDLELMLAQEIPDQWTPMRTEGQHPVLAAADASVHATSVLDANGGPILVGAGASIRANAVVIGPAVVGDHSTIIEHALIKPNTAIGPWCKVGGEVGGTIFQGYANKAHDGHLGDSWVGQWVNLGAGTTNSNLLNTYGQVVARATPDGPNEQTGEQFLGAIIGDHVKTAIATRIMTGAVIGTGTMWAATEPISGCIPAFTWATDGGRKPYRFEKFVEALRAVMGRRGEEPGREYLALIEALRAGFGQD